MRIGMRDVKETEANPHPPSIDPPQKRINKSSPISLSPTFMIALKVKLYGALACSK